MPASSPSHWRCDARQSQRPSRRGTWPLRVNEFDLRSEPTSADTATGSYGDLKRYLPIMLDPDGTRATLEELIAAWHADVRSVDIAVRKDITVGLVVYGLTAHTYAIAEGVLALYDHDYHAVAVPLVRQAIECAVTAMWVELGGPSAALSLLHEQTRNSRNTIAEFIRAGMPDGQGAIDRLEAELKDSFNTTSGAGRRVEQRCGELAGGGYLYAAYRAASDTAHAGGAVVDLYLEGTDGGELSPLGIRLTTHPNAEAADSWLRILLVMVVHATTAWSRLDIRRTARSRMKQLNCELGTSFQHAFAVEGLRQQSKRERELKAWRAAGHTLEDDLTT